MYLLGSGAKERAPTPQALPQLYSLIAHDFPEHTGDVLVFLICSLSNLVFPRSTLKSSLSVLHSQSLLGLGLLPVRFYFCSVDRQSRRMSCVEEPELIRSRVELRNTR